MQKEQPTQLNQPPEQTDEVRRATLGSSKFAAAIGLGKYNTPLEVYEQQLGLSKVKTNFKMKYGIINEPLTRERYEAENLPDGWKVIIPPQKAHPDEPWLTCHADGLVVDEQGELQWGIEIKNSGHRESVKEPCEDWIFQCMVAMVIWDVSRWDLVAQFANHDPVIHQLNWDEKTEVRWGKALALARAFWFNNVQAQCPPPSTAGDMQRFSTSKHSGEYITADDVLQADLRVYDALTKMIAALEQKREPVKQAIIEAIADDAGCEGDWGKVHYKLPKPASKVDWQKVATSLQIGRAHV